MRQQEKPGEESVGRVEEQKSMERNRNMHANQGVYHGGTNAITSDL